MNSLDILEAVGEADDGYIASAHVRVRQYVILWAGMAAAFVLLCVAVPIVFALAFRADAEPPTAQPDIYTVYVFSDGTLSTETLEGSEISIDEVVQYWREKNGVAESVKIEVSRVDPDGETGNDAEARYIISVTGDIGSERLLLDSLRMTVAEYYSVETDLCEIRLK